MRLTRDDLHNMSEARKKEETTKHFQALKASSMQPAPSQPAAGPMQSAAGSVQPAAGYAQPRRVPPAAGPAQPGPAQWQTGPAQPGPAYWQPAPAQPGPAQPGLKHPAAGPKQGSVLVQKAKDLVSSIFNAGKKIPMVKQTIKAGEDLLDAVGVSTKKPEDAQALVANIFRKRRNAPEQEDQSLERFVSLTEKMDDLELWKITEGVSIVQQLDAEGRIITSVNKKFRGMPAYCLMNNLQLKRVENLKDPFLNWLKTEFSVDSFDNAQKLLNLKKQRH